MPFNCKKKGKKWPKKEKGEKSTIDEIDQHNPNVLLEKLSKT